MPGDPQNLAAQGREAHAKSTFFTPSASSMVRPSTVRRGLGVHRVGPVDVQGDRVAHHHIGEGLGIGLGRVHGADVLPLAQHRHPVGDGHDLMELVRDDDDGLSVGLHRTQDGKETLGLLRGEHGGGLVQNEHVGPPVEHLHDLHRLLFRHRHVVDLLVGVDAEAVFIADGLDPGRDLPPVQPAAVVQAPGRYFPPR